MMLHWPEFEKRFRTLHRAELKRDPQLQREFRNARKADAAGLSRLGRRVLLPIFWVLIPASLILKREHGASLAFAVLSLWAAGTAFRWAQRWFQQFYASDDLVVLNSLPLNDAQVFRFQQGRFVRGFAWVLWEMLVAYVVLGMFDSGTRPAFYLLPLCALFQTVLILATAIHLANYLHALPLGAIAGLLRTTALVVLFWGIQSKEPLDAVINVSHWLFPTGWLNYTLIQAGLHRDYIVLILLVPILALIISSRVSWRRLRALYSLEGFEVVPSQAAASPDENEPEVTELFSGQRGPTAIQDRILEKRFLEGLVWEDRGWLERFVHRLLSARERIVAEFLVAANPGWTRSFKFALVIWAIASAMVLLFGHYSGTVVFFSAYFLATGSLPLLGGDWRGLRQVPSGGVFVPGYSVFPITFNEIAGILLKVNLSRILVTFPMFILFAAIGAEKLGHSPLKGASVAIHIFGVLVMLQPLLVLLPISKTTNDTSRMGALWWLLLVPVLLVLIGGSGWIFFTESLQTRLLLYAGLLALSSLFFAIYRWAYCAGRFDLLTRRMNGEP